MFFAAAIHAVLVCFSGDSNILSGDPDILREVVHLEEDAVGGIEQPLTCVRRAVLLYADDAGIVSKSGGGLDKIMTAIIIVFEAVGRTVPEKTTEAVLL